MKALALLLVALCVLPGCAGILGGGSTPVAVMAPAPVVGYRITFTSKVNPGVKGLVAPDTLSATPAPAEKVAGVNTATAAGGMGIVGAIVRSSPLIYVAGIMGVSGMFARPAATAPAPTSGSDVVAIFAKASEASVAGCDVAITIETFVLGQAPATPIVLPPSLTAPK